MAAERVIKLLSKQKFQYEVRDCERDFTDTSDAVKLLQVPMERIAKTLVFAAPIGVSIIVLAGDARIDAKKYEKRFKVKRIPVDEEDLMEYTGCIPGCVSPIAVPNKRAKVYIDRSLKPYEDEFVYTSGGTGNSAIGITSKDLFEVCSAKEWVDVSVGHLEDQNE